MKILYSIIIVLSLLLWVQNTSTAATKNPVFLKVPFTSQAPLREWSDKRFGDGCEEASVIMAVKWLRDEKIGTSSQEIKKVRDEIVKLADYQQKEYNNYHDTSAKDTGDRLLKGYYEYDSYVIKNVTSSQAIIKELERGNLVILPTNGRALANPYFSPPGPDRHMLVVKGYDYKNASFITNDPGTRRGESYKYPEKRLFLAINDYPSGNHLPITKNSKKMLVVYKPLKNK